MNFKATKAALATSIASLILCFTMLAGTTLAWFVDRVENTNNRIEAGNLAVDLVMYKETVGDYVSVANGSGDLFTETKGSPVQWSPGKTETIYLGVRNKGTLALSYEATIDVVEGALLGVLDYTIIDLGTTPPAYGGAMSIANSENSRRGNIVDLSQNLLLGRGALLKILEDPTVEENQKETHYYAFSVHMKDDAAPAFQGKTIWLDITVSATQIKLDDISSEEISVLSAIPEEKKTASLSGTLWKFNETITDYGFFADLDFAEENSEESLLVGCTVSDGENEYELSAFAFTEREKIKLLAVMPVEETEKTEETELTGGNETAELVFVYYEEETDDESKVNANGWYLLGFEEMQTTLENEETDLAALVADKEPVTDAEKLPIITFAEDDAEVLKNTDLINWLYQSAELLPADNAAEENS